MKKVSRSIKKKPSVKEKKSSAPTAQDFVVEVARLLSDNKCQDVAVLDLRKLSSVTDFVVIGSGTSDRQMHSAMSHIEALGDKTGFQAFRRNSDDRSTWLITDFVDVIVHLFERNTRAHYDLELLWGDAPRVEWERPGQSTRNRAGLIAGDTLGS